ncbi:MAG: class I SAM-dependent methyltransferase [Desulfosarcina sp.]|nr:class I SAM-dependent methyltransferase [Desulfobacterales bacterium]
MTIDVDPDWWKTLFDEVYLVTDARSVADDDITKQEIDTFTSLVPMQPHDRILDMCGGHGRHALELCRRGFRECTVLDYSQPLLDIGAQGAAAKRYPVRFVQGDARHTTLTSGAFDHVLILGNSLGYIPEPDADLHILQEGRRLLKSQGRLLLDVTDGEALHARITPQAWHEIGDDVVVCRQREVKDGRVCAREMVLSKDRGIIRDRTYCIRLYGADDLAALVTRAGFDGVQVHTDTSALNRTEDVGCMNHRLVVVARKP